MVRPAVILALAVLVLPTSLAGLPAGCPSLPVPPGICPAPALSAVPASATPAGLSQLQAVSDMECAFIENRGQLGRDDVAFYTSGPLSAYFACGRVEYRLLSTCADRKASPGASFEPSPLGGGSAFGLVFPGAGRVMPQGIEPLPYYFNYFLGNDPSGWRSFVPAYAGIVYRGLYDGIDLEFRQTGSGMKYQFVVQPGADPSVIRLRYDGADTCVRGNGLSIITPAGEVRDGGLAVFQDGPSKGRSAISASIEAMGDCYGYRMDVYDRGRPLVIDPLLSPAVVFSAVIGGNGADYPVGIALDAFGNSFVVGGTLSTDLPASPGAFGNVSRIGDPPTYDLFVLKLRSDGSSLLWCTYIGSGGNDYPHGIVADGYGFTYICGNTFDFDFPTTGFAFDNTYEGYGDAFVLKLNPAGSSIVYSTFVGGEYVDHGYALALDPEGNAYLTGSTTSIEFPTTLGANDTSIHAGTGLEDAYVLKLWANGSALAYSTYLGGDGVDYGLGIAVDVTGCAYVAGGTTSPDFPVTGEAFDKYSGAQDAFVTKVDPEGDMLVYSTCLGGWYDDSAAGIVLDAAGNAFVTGSTDSQDFPYTPGAVRSPSTGWEVFVSKLNANGTHLIYSASVGGSGDDRAAAICTDSVGNAYVAGTTSSSDLPFTPMAVFKARAGQADAFIVKLDPNADHLLYSSFIGGSGLDSAAALTIDRGGQAYLAGTTYSGDFPVTGTISRGNDSDVFVMRLKIVCTPTEPFLWAHTGDREVQLSWGPPAEGGDSVLYYDIYRGDSYQTMSKLMAVNGAIRTARDVNLRNGMTYFYAVVAANASGDGGRSTVLSVMPGLLPSEPWGLRALPGPGWVRLSWQAPNQTFDVPVLGYNVYRKYDLGDVPNILVPNLNNTTHIDTQVRDGTTFTYEVGAITILGEGRHSAMVSARPSSIPSEPRNLRAEVVGRRVVLGWDEPVNPGASPILCYTVYRRPENGRERLLGQASGQSFEDSQMPADTYYYRVAARSSTAEGYSSREVVATVINIPPQVGFVIDPAQGYSATEFSFEAASFDPDGKIGNFTWYFGDGGHSYREDPAHQYRSRGVYNVTLTVRDDDGATAIAEGRVVIFNTPPQIIDPRPPEDTTLAPGHNSVFVITPSDPDEDVLEAIWYLDGKIAGNGSRFPLVFNEEGTHQVRVSVSDGQDRAEKIWTVAVQKPPPPPPLPAYYYALGVLLPVIGAAVAYASFRAVKKRRIRQALARAEAQRRRDARAFSRKRKRRHGRKGKARRGAGKHSKKIL